MSLSFLKPRVSRGASFPTEITIIKDETSAGALLSRLLKNEKLSSIDNKWISNESEWSNLRKQIISLSSEHRLCYLEGWMSRKEREIEREKERERERERRREREREGASRERE